MWRLNLSLLKEDGIFDKVKGLWCQQAQDRTKSRIDKLVCALDDTKNVLRKLGIQRSKERREQEDGARKRLATAQSRVEQGLGDQDTFEEMDEAKGEL